MTSPPRTTAGGLLVGGEWADGGAPLAVLDKYSGETVAELRYAQPEDVDRAVAVAAATAAGPLLPVASRGDPRRRRRRVGGVMVNDTSSYHADAMPPRYAVQDMTDPRIVVLNLGEPGGTALS